MLAAASDMAYRYMGTHTGIDPYLYRDLLAVASSADVLERMIACDGERNVSLWELPDGPTYGDDLRALAELADRADRLAEAADAPAVAGAG